MQRLMLTIVLSGYAIVAASTAQALSPEDPNSYLNTSDSAIETFEPEEFFQDDPDLVEGFIDSLLAETNCSTQNGCSCSGDKSCKVEWRNPVSKRGGKKATCEDKDGSKIVCEDNDSGGCSCS